MKRLYSVAVVTLLGCGGGDFRSGAPSGPGGAGGGSEAGATSSSAEVSSSGVGSGGGGDGGDGAGGGAQSSASTGEGAGGAGGGPCEPKSCADLGKDCGPVDDGCGSPLDCGSCPVNETCGGDGTPGVCGGCVPKTCESETVYCATIADGCGNMIVCPGLYKLDPVCTFPSMYGCECPFDHGKSWYCDLPNGIDDPGNTPPPPGKGACVDNPQQPQFANFWCCETI